MENDALAETGLAALAFGALVAGSAALLVIGYMSWPRVRRKLKRRKR